MEQIVLHLGHVNMILLHKYIYLPEETLFKHSTVSYYDYPKSVFPITLNIYYK